jgi:hypothetical protein
MIYYYSYGGLAELGLMQGIANPPIHAKMYPLVQIQHPPPWEISSVVEQCADNAEVGGSSPPFPT